MATYYTKSYAGQVPEGYTSQSQVAELQRQLNAKGANLKVDGVYGPATAAAYGAYGGGRTGGSSSSIPSGYSQYVKDFQALLSDATPSISYTPMSEAEIKSNLEAALRPGVDLAIARRKDQTLTNKANIDVDAASRGMGASTWVTDVKNRAQNEEADDIAYLESQYGATIAQQFMNALQQEKANQLAVDQYNASAKASALQSALGLAGDFYANDLAMAQQAAGSGGRRSGGYEGDDIEAWLNSLSKAGKGTSVAGTTIPINSSSKKAGSKGSAAKTIKGMLTKSAASR